MLPTTGAASPLRRHLAWPVSIAALCLGGLCWTLVRALPSRAQVQDLPEKWTVFGVPVELPDLSGALTHSRDLPINAADALTATCKAGIDRECASVTSSSFAKFMCVIEKQFDTDPEHRTRMQLKAVPTELGGDWTAMTLSMGDLACGSNSQLSERPYPSADSCKAACFATASCSYIYWQPKAGPDGMTPYCHLYSDCASTRTPSKGGVIYKLTRNYAAIQEDEFYSGRILNQFCGETSSFSFYGQEDIDAADAQLSYIFGLPFPLECPLSTFAAAGFYSDFGYVKDPKFGVQLTEIKEKGELDLCPVPEDWTCNMPTLYMCLQLQNYEVHLAYYAWLNVTVAKKFGIPADNPFHAFSGPMNHIPDLNPFGPSGSTPSWGYRREAQLSACCKCGAV